MYWLKKWNDYLIPVSSVECHLTQQGGLHRSTLVQRFVLSRSLPLCVVLLLHSVYGLPLLSIILSIVHSVLLNILTAFYSWSTCFHAVTTGRTHVWTSLVIWLPEFWCPSTPAHEIVIKLPNCNSWFSFPNLISWYTHIRWFFVFHSV